MFKPPSDTLFDAAGMTVLNCPDCGTAQEVRVDIDTYSVECQACTAQFDVPRKHRKEKAELREYKSRVNIRVGFRDRGDDLDVAWTVQSAERGNRYLERDARTVDINGHPQKTRWYVAILTMLRHVGEYKSARIWVKHDGVVDHLAGDFETGEDDLRTPLVQSITELADQKFYGCEFGTTDNVGRDIHSLLD